MRILVCVHYWRPHRGGIETVAYEESSRLARRGHQVTVLTSHQDGDRFYERAEGIDVYRIAAWNILEERAGIPFPLFSPQLVAVLNRLIPQQDIVLAHGHVYLPSVVAAALCRLHGKPLVLFQHSPFIRYPLPWSAVEYAADQLLGAPVLRSATKLLTPSRHTAAYVRSLAPRRRVTVLYHGVDCQRFTPLATGMSRSDLRASLGLPRHGFLVLSVRRLVFRNGLDILLDAASLLREQKEIQFVIVGRGPEASLLASAIKRRGLEQCHLAGLIPDEQLPLYYQAADVFVLPTRTGEGFGLVLLEASASGVPVIAASGGGQDEAVEDGRTGFLIPAGDPGALAQAIERLYCTPELAGPMARESLRRAKGQDWDRHVARLEQLLQSVIMGFGASACG